MATVELSFTPLPAHVRTARLVATAVARRSRVEESLLDEVRLAVGEACSRAVEAHRLHCPAEPVRIELSDRDGRFEVVVIDAVPSGAHDGPPGRAHGEPVGAQPHRGAAADVASSSVPGGAAGGGAAAVEAEPAGAEGAGAEGVGAEPVPAEAVGVRTASGGPGGTPGGAGGTLGGPAGGQPGGPERAGTDAPAVGLAADSEANGGLPVDIGLAVIEGLADDVHVSATSRGVTIRMSWPIAPPK